ncbi:MAG: spore coat associated protein CotJA [Christensenellales bacterium]
MKYEDYPDMAAMAKVCVPWEQVISDVMLARAYVPWQKLCETYKPMRSLKAGTAFPELFMPYSG